MTHIISLSAKLGRATVAGVALWATMTVMGCATADKKVDEITANVERTIDCNAVCTRYRDCLDKDYDVDACQTRCEARMKESPRNADDCEACIDDRSCGESVFPCADECMSIVP